MSTITLHKRPAWVEAQGHPLVASVREKLIKESSRLDFDPGPHVYTDRETGFNPVCVSDVVESFCNFNEDAKSLEIFRRDYDNPNAKYYRMTQQQILDAWHEKAERSTSRGTALHAFAEACVCVSIGRPGASPKEYWRLISDNGNSIDAEDECQAGIVSAFSWMPDFLVPVAKEARLYNSNYGYAGMMDLLLADLVSGYHVLTDWKTNEALDKKHYEHMKPPFSHFWDTSLYHYKVQQSLYQIRLEELLVRVGARFLLHVDPAGRFCPVPVESVTEILRRILRERKEAGLKADGSARTLTIPSKTA